MKRPPRKSAEWMALLDDRILEHLSEEPWSSASLMAARPEFRASRARIAERCRLLARVELLAPIYGDTFELTTLGQGYLDGEVDVQHYPPPIGREW